MVELIGNHRILCAEEGFEQAAIGVETGGVEDGVVHTEKFRQPLFQLFVQGLRAADEPHGSHAITPIAQALGRGGIHGGMLRQPQVVVGAEVQHLPLCHTHVRALGRCDEALVFGQPRGLDIGQLAGQVFPKCAVHVGSFLPVQYDFTRFAGAHYIEAVLKLAETHAVGNHG